MDITTIVGLVVAFGALITAVIIEGGSVLSFLSPSAMLIVFGGTLGATLISFPMAQVKKLPKALGKAFKDEHIDLPALLEELVSMADNARKNGLLALDEAANSIKDPFLKRGLLLVIDGTDPEIIRSVLEIELTKMEQEEESYHSMLETMGGFAPTMGIIGTVMGLVHVLSNLSDPSTLGESISTAFIATLWGVSSANLLWLPIGTKLKRKGAISLVHNEMVVEGVMAIQAGENPRVVRERLMGFLRDEGKKEKKGENDQSEEVGQASPEPARVA